MSCRAWRLHLTSEEGERRSFLDSPRPCWLQALCRSRGNKVGPSQEPGGQVCRGKEEAAGESHARVLTQVRTPSKAAPSETVCLVLAQEARRSNGRGPGQTGVEVGAGADHAGARVKPSGSGRCPLSAVLSPGPAWG